MRPRAYSGFTVLEMQVALAISALVVAGTISIFFAQQNLYRRQRQVSDMNQNVRMALDFVVDDVRMAGYGVPVPATEFPLWIDWVGGVSNAVWVTQGASASDPDRISITAAFGDPVTSLNSASSAGDTVVQLPVHAASIFDTTTRKVIYIGKTELARIVSIAGFRMTISTDPVSAGAGLEYDYPAGTPVELVQVVSYYCNNNPTNFPYRPFLAKDDNRGLIAREAQKIVAVGIENLQARQTSNAVAIVLTARTAEPDTAYTHPVAGDHYWRKTVNSDVTLRNAAQ
ncbi:MAG: hypothetical protein HQ559_07865 [Lentisphaerae bacterium]|nr:hypothetical protein [Lentisphaerota bacterium]